MQLSHYHAMQQEVMQGETLYQAKFARNTDMQEAESINNIVIRYSKEQNRITRPSWSLHYLEKKVRTTLCILRPAERPAYRLLDLLNVTHSRL